MHENLHPNSRWLRCEDVPILITPPQDECYPPSREPHLSSTFDTHHSLETGPPVVDPSLTNPSFASQSLGEPRNVHSLYLDISDSECELSGHGSVGPSPVPSPLGDTAFALEEDAGYVPIPGRRDSFTHSDTSELNEDINNLFIQEFSYTNFPNFSTDTLSPFQTTSNGRSRSASMSVLQTPQLPEAPFCTSSLPYTNTNLNPVHHSFPDLPSAFEVQGLMRSRANSMSALPPSHPIMTSQSPNHGFYSLLSSDYFNGHSPVGSPPLEQFQTAYDGSVESLPALSSSYSSYQSYYYDSNSSSTEYLSLDDTGPGTEYHHHSSVLSYNLSDLSSHPYPMKGKRAMRSHVCHFCQRPFTRKHDLHRHIRVHTGDKPYKCDLCGKTFARTDALKRHHRVDEECGKAHENGGKSQEELPVKEEDP